MAINPETQYPGKIAPSTPDYPYGAARNITNPGDGTGTPWEAALVNDIFGFQQAILAEGGAVPSGNPEKATNSQYLAALTSFLSRKYNTVADMISATALLKVGEVVKTDGYFSNGVGGNVYEIVAGGTGTDDGGSFIDLSNGLQAKGLFPNGVVYLEQFGVSTTASESNNAAAYISALTFAKTVKTQGGPYTFDFAGSAVTYPSSTLFLDLGDRKHTFKDFGGMLAPALKKMYFNGRFDCADTELINLVNGPVLEVMAIDNIEVTGVFMDGNQLHLVDWEHTSDLPFMLVCQNAVFKNWKNRSPTVPMTAFGTFDSGATYQKRHYLAFANLDVDEWYSVDTDGTTVIDGESDFFRMFQNPSSINVANLSAVNFAKRFVKSQDVCVMNVGYCFTSLDARFTASLNHIGTFEAQTVNQTEPSRFRILEMDADYSAASGTPILFNASGLEHEFVAENVRFSNVGAFSASENIKFELRSARGDKLRVNAIASNRIKLTDFVDTDMLQMTCSECLIEDFEISSSTATSAFFLSGADLRNGEFKDWETGNRIASFTNIDRVKVTYSVGGADGRPFRPVSGRTTHVTKLEIDNPTGSNVIYFNDSANSGEVIFRDFRSNAGQLAFFSGGTWDIVLDNCDNGTVTGAGVNSLLTATYA